jgi:hypothetical protein
MKKGFLAVTLFAVVALAGCGGGGKPSGVASLTGSSGNGGGGPTTTVSKADIAKLYANWAACMRQHGVNMADPTIDGQGGASINVTGGDKASMSQAMTACQSLNDAAQRASTGGKPMPKPDPSKMLAFSKCMRAHGLPDFPDPNTNGGGIGIAIQDGKNSDLNPNSPTFQNAQKACQSLMGLPKGGQGIHMSGGPGPGPGGGPDSGSGSVSSGGK